MPTQIISFNVNGIRARQQALDTLIQQYRPAIIGLQETKVEDALFPQDGYKEQGYQAHFFGQKGHYGVAFLIDETQVQQVDSVTKGFAQGEDAQKRFIGAKLQTEVGEITVYNGYFPQGETSAHPTKFKDKQQFYANLAQHLQSHHTSSDPVIVMGDFNVAYQDIDVGIGESNQKRWLREGKCCFLPLERQWYKVLTDWGLMDSYRATHPDCEHYSWFDYRSGGFDKTPKRGLRIDHILATEAVLKNCQSTAILSHFRGGEKPSDHCPVVLTLG